MTKKLALRVVLTNKSSSSASNSTSASTSKESIYSEEEEEEELDVESSTVDSESELELESENDSVPSIKLPTIRLKTTVNNNHSKFPRTDDKSESDVNILDYMDDDAEEEDYEPAVSKKLTARQKAMLEEPKSEMPDSMVLIIKKSGKKELTEEEQMKKLEESRRRKDQREQKLEENKMATIQRLLHKQSARSKKVDSLTENTKVEAKKEELPLGCMRYTANQNGKNLLIPTDLVVDFYHKMRQFEVHK